MLLHAIFFYILNSKEIEQNFIQFGLYNSILQILTFFNLCDRFTKVKFNYIIYKLRGKINEKTLIKKS